MKIPFYYLLDQLKTTASFSVLGQPEADFPMTRPRFLLADAVMEPGRLYVTSESVPEAIPTNTAVFTTRTPALLLNQLQELFDTCELWEEALQTASANGELRELLDEVETILGNPVLVYKSNYSIVSCSGEVFSEPALTSLRGSHLPFDYVNTLKRDPQYGQFNTVLTPFFYNNPITKTPALGINLHLEDEIRCRLTLIPLQRAIQPGDRFLMTLCAEHVTAALKNTIISGRFEDPTGRKERLVELFRTGVENENADQIVLEQGFSSLGWLPNQQYCSLCIQSGTSEYLSHTAELLSNQLESLLPASCVFTRLGTTSVLLNLSQAGASVREILEKCVFFFRDNDLRCGISNTFTGFSHMRYYHRQAQIALGFASRPQAFLWTRYFSDLVLDYILEQSNRELPLHLICSQQVLQLKEYDEKHQTDFYSTLECYILNKFNAVQTAKELRIHRSTFLYRMERLQTLFGLDLNQRDSLLYILLSMKMLELSKSMILHDGPEPKA